MAQNQSPIIDKLFSVGAHFGYAPSRRHPSQEPFIFGRKGGIELFDLEKTARCLEQALGFVKSLAEERKTILFVGGKPEARVALKRTAEALDMPYVAGRWIGGSLTNFSEIKKRLARLAELSGKRERGELAQYTKRERLLIDREIADLEVMFGGIKNLTKIPDALFVIDPKREAGAVEEARAQGLPIIALLNTDCDKSKVTYPIPGNDASRQAISFVLDEVSKTYSANVGALPQAKEQKE
jgi:small subunit ribosomal protein S2